MTLKRWPARPSSFTVRCMSDPSPDQLDAISDYVRQRIARWHDGTYPLPEVHVVAGVQVVVERKADA